jgi:O-antigen biosynthesis protein
MSLNDKFSESVCNICGETGRFKIKNINPDIDEMTALRENIYCDNCGSISRDRMMIYGFQQCFGLSSPLSKLTQDKHFTVLDTSGTRGHPGYFEKLYDYYNIWYEPDILKSGKYDKRKYGNLEKLTFPDNYFDVILSSDVFEHIRLDLDAFTEVYRTLKPGGCLILQVPFAGVDNNTIELVRVEGDKDIFLAPPQYHAANTLVYRIFGGKELIPNLWNLGFFVKYMDTEIPQNAISRQNMMMCIKTPIG